MSVGLGYAVRPHLTKQNITCFVSCDTSDPHREWGWPSLVTGKEDMLTGLNCPLCRSLLILEPISQDGSTLSHFKNEKQPEKHKEAGCSKIRISMQSLYPVST